MASFDEVKWTGQQGNPERIDTAFTKISRPVRYMLILALFGASSAVGEGKWAIGSTVAENIDDVSHMAFIGMDSFKARQQAYDIGGRAIDAVIGAGIERNRAGGYEAGLQDTTIDVYATRPHVAFSEITIAKDIQRPDSQFDSQYKVVVTMRGNSPDTLKTGEMGEDDIIFVSLQEQECSKAAPKCVPVGYTEFFESFGGRWVRDTDFEAPEHGLRDMDQTNVPKSVPASESILEVLLPQHR